MNEKDERYFKQRRQELQIRINQAKENESSDLANLQAELCELKQDESNHRFHDSLEE